jgi:hypothetical protein
MTLPRPLKLLTKDRESGWTFTLLVCVPYLAFLIWMHVHHEMWRDEIHAWTLSRLVHGFWELVTGDRIYAGHPPLWYWYLRVWTWFMESAWGIQAATAAAAVAAAVLLLRFAPFPRYLKVMVLFSYYFGFEYSVMARNYVLGWLLLCLFCAIYHPIRTRYFALAFALALLSLTSIYGLIMCIFLLGFFVLDQFRMSNPRPGLRPTEYTFVTSPRIFAAIAIVSAVMLFCVLTIEPPDPNPFSPAFNFAALTPSALPNMLYRVTAGILPWRKATIADFWGTSCTLWDAKSTWPPYVGAALLLLATLALYPSWRLMLAYLGAVAAMMAFQEARFEGAPRHWGHFFMFLVSVCWLARLQFPKRSHWFSTVLLTGILAMQVQSLVAATVVDTREVFSGGRDTAAFILNAGLQDLPFVAGPDYTAATVAGYLRRPFYAAETAEYDENVVFHNRRRPFSPQELMNRAVGVLRERNSPVLLVCNQGLPDPPPGIRRTLLFTSRPGIVADEIFSVYRLEAQAEP